MKEPSSTQAPHCSASPSSSSTAAGPSFTAWTHATPPFGSTLRKHTFKPSTLSPTQLLIEVDRAAANPVDVQIANSSVFKLAALSYPKGIGEDYAGIVIAQGREVIEFAVGDTVLGFYLTAVSADVDRLGGLRQAMGRRIIPSPDGRSLIRRHQVLSLGQTFSDRGGVVPSRLSNRRDRLDATLYPKIDSFRPSIVVLGGSSGVGIYAIQYAKSELGAPKIVATCSGKNAEFVRSLGANHVIDYISENILEGLLKHRPAEGYTTILDCVGGTALLPHLGRLLTHADGSSGHPGGGYITIVGDATDSERIGGATVYWYSPRMVWRTLWSWYGLSSKWRYSCISLKAPKDKLHKGVELIQDKGIKVVVDSEYEFDDVEKAFKKLRTRRARGKIVIKVKANSDRL